jgi:hypothetical protein
MVFPPPLKVVFEKTKEIKRKEYDMSSFLLLWYFVLDLHRVKFTLYCPQIPYTVQYTTTPFQCCGSESTWNCIILGSQIRKLDPDPHQSQIKELWRLKMEPWRAVDAHNGGLEAQNRVVDGLVAAYSHHYDEEQNPDPVGSRSESTRSGSSTLPPSLPASYS